MEPVRPEGKGVISFAPDRACSRMNEDRGEGRWVIGVSRTVEMDAGDGAGEAVDGVFGTNAGDVDKHPV